MLYFSLSQRFRFSSQYKLPNFRIVPRRTILNFSAAAPVDRCYTMTGCRLGGGLPALHHLISRDHRLVKLHHEGCALVTMCSHFGWLQFNNTSAILEIKPYQFSVVNDEIHNIMSVVEIVSVRELQCIHVLQRNAVRIEILYRCLKCTVCMENKRFEIFMVIAAMEYHLGPV